MSQTAEDAWKAYEALEDRPYKVATYADPRWIIAVEHAFYSGLNAGINACSEALIEVVADEGTNQELPRHD